MSRLNPTNETHLEMRNPGLSVIIPTFNEADSILPLLRLLSQTLVSRKIPHEIIVIDDHSTDYTVRLVRQFARTHSRVQLHLKRSQPGMGYSVIEGYSYSKYEYLCLLDADGHYSPQHIPKLFQMAQKTGFAIAHRPDSWRHNLGHFGRHLIENMLARWLLNVQSDVESGLKIFAREVFDHLDQSLVSGWVIDAPLVFVAHELGLTGSRLDIPFVPRDRPHSLWYIWRKRTEQLTGYLKTAFRHRRAYILPGNGGMTGAGIAFRRRRFVTHTNLPEQFSALITFVPWQLTTLLSLLAILSLGLWQQPRLSLIALTSLLSVIYLLDVIFNLIVTLKSLHFPPEINLATSELMAIPEESLPTYTILCPLYKEARILPQFVEAMSQLNYPTTKLQIMLLLEADDVATIRAAQRLRLPSHFEIVVVPDSHPKTKPKACNYGLALARGEYIVIFDAEDKPDPNQLRSAYLAFTRAGSEVVCLQAKLNYYNPRHNLLTRLFTAEYSLWFDVILPGLQSIRTTIPLGGTSNHFKTSVLRTLQGWDPFNVTEDCDLGARLFNAGYKTAVINSTTLEEANSDFGNWLRQRSRWLKGYMQTYLVHMRHPLELWRQQGWHSLFFQLIVGGKVSFILINPFLWLMTLAYFFLKPVFGAAIESIYPAPVFYVAFTSLLLGNFVALYNYMIGIAKKGQWDLMKYVFLIPLYWVAISVAAGIGLYQLIFRPHYWEKTIHGLHLVDEFPKTPPARAARGRKFQKVADLVTGAWSAGGIMVLASVFGNFMNFIYNAYLSRHLDLAAFGDISLFGSFMYLSSVPISALSRSVTHTSAFLLGKYNAPALSLWSKVNASALRLSLLASVLWLLATPMLQTFFKVESTLPFILFTPVWIISALGAVNGGFLSGNLNFTVLAFTAILESVSKFGFAALFVTLDSSSLVYAATALSLLLVFIVEFAVIRRLKAPASLPIEAAELKLSTKFYWTSVLTTLTKSTFLSLDLMLAKHYLSPLEAGSYSYLSLAGKMVFFLSSSFSQFLIPYASRDLGAGKSPRHSFLIILALVSLVNLAGVVGFGLLGEWSAPLLWGEQAISILPYLPQYTLAMAFFSLASFITTYQQIRHRHLFPIIGFIIGALQLLGMAFFHQSVHDLVFVVMVASIVALVAALGLSYFYNSVYSLGQAFLDFVGLFRPLPFYPPLGNAKLRILIFNWRDGRHKWAGGAEVYLHELAKRWVKAGHKVTLFCGNDGTCPRFETQDGVNIIRRGGFYFVYFWAFIYYIFRLRGRYDVILDSENGIPFFTPLYAKEKVFLLIHHVHQEIFRQSLRPPFSYLAIFLEKKLMPKIYQQTEVLTVSPSSQKDIMEHKLTHQKPRILYNGVDLTICHPGPKSKTPLILYLGRLTKAKSVDVLIEAAARVLTDLPSARFVIAGDGPARRTLERLSAKLGLTAKVSFLGKVSEAEKVRLMQAAWVFVNPSLIEGWGITTIEANACGTVVIGSDVAGLRDAIRDRETGILVPYGDVSALHSNLIYLLKDHQTRAQLASQALKWASQFDWEVSAKLGLKYIMPDFVWSSHFPSPSYQATITLGTGIYRRRPIFLKSWNSPRPSPTALNEVAAYEYLSRVAGGILRVPKLHFAERINHTFTLGLELLKGQPLKSQSPAVILRTYRRLLQSLSTLPRYQTVPRTHLFVRGPFYLLFSLPWIAGRALLNYPASYSLLLYATWQALRQSRYLFGQPLTFVHRDLNSSNIMLGADKSLHLIDFQYSGFSLAEYEYAGIIRSFAAGDPLVPRLLSLILTDFCRDQASRARFQYLTITYCLLGLNDPSFPPSRTAAFFDLLRKVGKL